MLTMEGLVINVFETPKGTTKEGEEYGGNDKVQLLCDQYLRNGESRKELFTLTCNKSDFDTLHGKPVRVPVGVLANKGNVLFYIPKGSKPVPMG